MKATYIKTLEGFRGEARLYKLDPPLKDYDGENEYEYVVVSAVIAPFSGPETYIFPATAEGEIVSFGELPGSYRGGMDHEVALVEAGYEVEEEVGL